MPTYPGIYQAMATRVNNLGVEVLIPQVFGEAPITVQRFIHGPPTEVGLGWIMFVAGNPEFPVWASGITTIQVGGDTPTPLGINEVWVGPGEPTDADVELWVDSDASAPSPTYSTWITLPLLNSWTNVGVGNVPNQYRMVGDIVYVRAYIAHTAPTPSGGTPIAQLPLAYCPQYLVPVSVAYSIAGPGYSFTSLNVMPDGYIRYYGATNAIDFMVIDFDFSVSP